MQRKCWRKLGKLTDKTPKYGNEGNIRRELQWKIVSPMGKVADKTPKTEMEDFKKFYSKGDVNGSTKCHVLQFMYQGIAKRC